MVALDNFEKAIVQILITATFIEDSLFKSHFNDLKKHMPYNKTISDCFTAINANLRNVSMEVKTVIMKREVEDEPTRLIHYHAIVNTDADSIAKDIKSYSDKEITFFRALFDKLIEEKYLSVDDIARVEGAGAKDFPVDAFLQRLITIGWLQRDDRNYWEFGPRVYAELNQYIETSIRNNENSEEDIQDRLKQLPQVIYY